MVSLHAARYDSPVWPRSTICRASFKLFKFHAPCQKISVLLKGTKSLFWPAERPQVADDAFSSTSISAVPFARKEYDAWVSNDKESR